jgi:DNA processing protein
MAIGLLVVEAARRSGSLITARLAGEMGRLVFAVPGSPLDPRAGGTNGLLKDGAILTTEAGDVLDAIKPLCGGDSHRAKLPLEESADLSTAPPPQENERMRVVKALGPTPVEIDEIIRHTGLEPAQVQMVLLELDLIGRLERHAGGHVSLLASQ